MKKNRFIMKSALFALVLGFGFFNDVNAASKELVDNLKGYQKALELVVSENEFSDEIINNLNKEVEKLREAGLTDLPNMVNFYKESKELTQDYKKFIDSLVNFIKSDDETKVTLTTLGLFEGSTSLVNKLKEARSLRVFRNADEVVKSLGVDTYDISLDFYNGKRMISSSDGKDFFIVQRTLKDLKPNETYNELLTQYRNIKSKATTIVQPLNTINSLVSKKGYKDFLNTKVAEKILNVVKLVNKKLNDTYKPILEESLFVLLRMEKVYNEYLKNSIKVFTDKDLKKEPLLEDIEKAVSHWDNKPEHKTPSTTSDLGIFANIIEEAKKAKAADPKLRAVATEEKVEESTKTTTETKTVTAAPAAAQKTLTATTTKTEQNMTTKKVEKKAPAAADSDKESVLTIPNYTELHYFARVHNRSAAEKILQSAMGDLYKPEMRLRLVNTVYNSPTLEDCIKALKEYPEFKDLTFTVEAPESK